MAMAGLPGTGKSTVALALARAVEGVILDKDRVREALFPPGTIEYSPEQDDLCIDVMLQVAAFLLRRNPDRTILLDGRTFTRRYQVETLARSASQIPARLVFIECICSEATALHRLEIDRAGRVHPAADRDASLYRRLKTRAEPLDWPHLTVDTESPLADIVAACMRYLSTPP